MEYWRTLLPCPSCCELPHDLGRGYEGEKGEGQWEQALVVVKRESSSVTMVMGQLPVANRGGVSNQRQGKPRNVTSRIHISLYTHVAIDDNFTPPTQWQARLLQEVSGWGHTHSSYNDLARQGLP